MQVVAMTTADINAQHAAANFLVQVFDNFLPALQQERQSVCLLCVIHAFVAFSESSIANWRYKADRRSLIVSDRFITNALGKEEW